MRHPDAPPSLRLPAPLRGLRRLAYNAWWSWNPDARELWEEIAGRVAASRSPPEPLQPLRLLAAARSAALEALARDAGFLARFRKVFARFDAETVSPPPKRAGGVTFSPARPVAYFSMEFGIHASLPIYAGGLGILAGDHLKTASDARLPLIGVGLAYRQSYFRQEIDRRGRQRVIYPRADYGKMPMELVRRRGGKELRIRVALPDVSRRPIELRVWRVAVGAASVYLLDSDFDANAEPARALCRRLYGGTRADRLGQEILIGLGGVRLIRALGLDPTVWHLNEGHVALSALERIRELTAGSRGLGFDEAVEAVAADTVFTTHTPVPEGNEVFDLPLARRYLAPHCDPERIPTDGFLGLGLDATREGKPILSMTVLAMRLSRLRNGVSRLHGEVARGMWQRLWPDFPAEDAPIGSVTNGVHVPTWIAPEMDRIFRRRVAASWRARVDRPETWRKALEIPDRELWSARNELRQRLVRFVRDRVRRQLEREGVSSSLAQRQAESVLDPGAFTIGFARRFALYKRADLIFHDLQRARALFHRPRQPVQLVYAGKPHPEDAAGRALLERVVAFSMRPEFRGRVVVLENYDIDVGAVLVQGVDLWLNNPLRPQEASGTSGQKVPFNGGLNASILDGWWDEGFDPKVGWAFGKASDHESRREQDLDDAKGLHDVLAREIVPLFYERGRDGIPRRWLEKVRHSMAALIPSFSSRRMLSRYIDELYIPAARLGRRLRAGGEAIDSRAVRDIVDCRESIERSWPLIHVREVHSSRWRGRRSLSVDCFLAGLSPELARCEVRFLERRPAGAESWSAPLPCETVLPAANGGSATFIFLMPERKAPRARIRLAAQCPGLPANELGLCVEVEAEA